VRLPPVSESSSRRFKAAFFERLGYSASSWQQLEEDLRVQHLSADATLREETEHGRKYEIHGILRGPRGSASVVTIWIIREGEDDPRLVTAYPGD
jgi:hypothetical protein